MLLTGALLSCVPDPADASPFEVVRCALLETEIKQRNNERSRKFHKHGDSINLGSSKQGHRTPRKNNSKHELASLF